MHDFIILRYYTIILLLVIIIIVVAVEYYHHSRTMQVSCSIVLGHGKTVAVKPHGVSGHNVVPR